jgi:hypothetical protein
MQYLYTQRIPMQIILIAWTWYFRNLFTVTIQAVLGLLFYKNFKNVKYCNILNSEVSYYKDLFLLLQWDPVLNFKT